jgi:hypothetical protein
LQFSLLDDLSHLQGGKLALCNQYILCDSALASMQAGGHVLLHIQQLTVHLCKPGSCTVLHFIFSYTSFLHQKQLQLT